MPHVSRVKKERGVSFVKGYEPKLAALSCAMDRARSLPPVNPFWSERVQQEVWLQHHRPEDLPAPHDDGDLEEGGMTGGTGKGRGLSTGGQVFATPPSHQTPEGRGGQGAGKRSKRRMSSGDVAGEPVPGPCKSMGPMPPEHVQAKPRRGHESEGNLQRALEAEMVTFLREQNDHLRLELEEMKKKLAGGTSSSAPSAPSSWEFADGMGAHQPGDEEMGNRSRAGGVSADDKRPSSKNRVDGLHTPRRRSPTTRRVLSGRPAVRYTPNGTQVPDGQPPELPEVPLPPFGPPTSCNSAEISLLQGYEILDELRRRRGDQHWLPLGVREGKAFEPQENGFAPRDDRATRLEKEVDATENLHGADAGSFAGSWTRGCMFSGCPSTTSTGFGHWRPTGT